ncbi:MAG: flagellar biosynthetic protein FliQ, partial [Myxococcales bacterium]
MTEAALLLVGREALLLMVLASAPPLIASLVVGALASVLQAITSIQESTLT